jgi:hypothetical protein
MDLKSIAALFFLTIGCGLVGSSSTARAVTIDSSAVTNVLYGTITVGGSVENIVVDETGYGAHIRFVPLTSQQYSDVFTPSVAAAIGSSVYQQLAVDPITTGLIQIIDPMTGLPLGYAPGGTPIPKFVLTAIANSANANILGLSSGVGVGVGILPDPATAAFNTILQSKGITTPAVFTPVDALFDTFTYEADVALQKGNFAGDTLTVFDNFQFFQMAGSVPEPSTWVMMVLGFLGLGFLTYRKTGALHPQQRAFIW